jgi:hypothetical protein
MRGFRVAGRVILRERAKPRPRLLELANERIDGFLLLGNDARELLDRALEAHVFELELGEPR